jgi:hypothetical protein
VFARWWAVKSCDDAVDIRLLVPITGGRELSIVGVPDSDPESLGEAIYDCASGWDNLTFALGQGVVPANAVLKFAHGVGCVSSGLTSESKSTRRGCGVGNLSRGRDMEFITDNKKERRRVCGVIEFSSLSSAGRCDGVPAGVWNGWMSKRALE